MNLLQAAVLGITQGLSEFAPISSSGHLILVPWAFGWTSVLKNPEANKAFDVALHMGTFVGAAAYLRRDLAQLIRAWFRSVSRRRVETPEQRLAWFVVLSAIPGALAGALGENVINERFGQPWQIAAFLAVFGVVLWLVDRQAAQRTSYHDVGRGQATAMAIAQAVALMPGVSRSGITITAARATGLTRDAAARFSFLMSLPITLGAGLFAGWQVLSGDVRADGIGPAAVAVGIAASGVSGAAAVWGVLAFVRRHSLRGFMWYRLVIAAVMLALITTNVRSATL